jgi:engulfment and cell motility protein 1
MELDYGWSTLDSEFIYHIVHTLSSLQTPINVCRPATAILKKLVEADPMNAPGSFIPGSSRGQPMVPEDSVYRYGFSVVFEQMWKDKEMLKTVVSRLESADTAMAQYRWAYSSS